MLVGIKKVGKNKNRLVTFCRLYFFPVDFIVNF